MAIGVQGQDDRTDQSVQAYQIVFENGTVYVKKIKTHCHSTCRTAQRNLSRSIHIISFLSPPRLKKRNNE